MGGRGASSGIRSNGAGDSAAKVAGMNTKFTTKQINSMSRSQLELVAKAVFVKQNIARGMTADEAARRASALMSGNSTAQLRKYISKNG